MPDIIKKLNDMRGNPLFAAKIDHLYSNQILGQVATLANGAILAFIQRDMVVRPLLLSWLGILFIVTFARTWLLWQYHRKPNPHDTIGFWTTSFLAGICISGMTWGVAGIIFYPKLSGAHQMFTAFTIGGMVAGASAAFSSIRLAFYAFSLPAMVPIIVYSFMYQDSIHIAMAVMLLLFLILMSGTSYRSYATIDASIRLNIDLQQEVCERNKAEFKLEAHQKELESVVDQRTIQLRTSNQALKESEERYRLLVENAIVGIILIQGQVIKFANSFITTITGYTQDEIIDSPFIQFVHPDDRELAAINHVRRLSGKPVPESYQIRILDKQEQAHWLEVNAVRLLYEDTPAILVFCRDITQQRNLEAQLIQSEKMASIGQLAAGVAHEINNPVGFVQSNLTTFKEYQEDLQELILLYQSLLSEKIQGGIGALSDTEMDEKIKSIKQCEAQIDLDHILADWSDLVEESLEGTRRIKEIVLDLKDFAHPGRHGLQLTDINANMKSTLNIVWNELKYNADVIEDFSELPEIECYPQQLNQVFMNLLINAAQAIDGHGEIKIATRFQAGVIEIKISDTGVGIAKENLTKIFDPFFTTKPVGKGTGLGLNVSYNIIQRHNGTLDVESTVGKGSIFTIRLAV